MARSERLMSDPAEVVFGGFVSDTYTLQKAGWVLSMNQDVRGSRLQLALHHPGAGLYMIAEDLRFDFMGGAMDQFNGRRERPRFTVRHCSSKIVAQVMMDFSKFYPVDAEPQFVTMERKSIEDFKIFATPLVRTEEIIIEPQSVAECLELIRKMQAPELAAIRKRNADRDQPINQQHFHAQILSIAA